MERPGMPESQPPTTIASLHSPAPESPFIDVPSTSSARERPVLITLAGWVLLVYAVAEFGAFRMLMYGITPLILLGVTDSALCIIVYLVFAYGLLNMAPWARKGTVVMLIIRVAVAYSLMLITDFALVGTFGTYTERQAFQHFALLRLARSFGVSVLTLLPIILLLLTPAVKEAFYKAARKESL